MWQQIIANWRYCRRYSSELQRILTTEEIKNQFLLATDHEKMTIWHVAARQG
jgi:adenine C2-methylase RlmN of 23S rRNA A2503 and tRNA A37